MTVPELIQYWGYNVEVHYVTTKDGYILGLQRLKGQKARDGDVGSDNVILLQHGLFGSSARFTSGPPNSVSITYKLNVAVLSTFCLFSQIQSFFLFPVIGIHPG